jgi:hypothetical protein
VGGGGGGGVGGWGLCVVFGGDVCGFGWGGGERKMVR